MARVEISWNHTEGMSVMDYPDRTASEVFDMYVEHDGFHGGVLEIGDMFMVRSRCVHGAYGCTPVVENLKFIDD